MKKILILSPIIGNLTSFRRELILRLLNDGYKVTLACDYEEEFEEFSQAGANYIRVPIDRRGANPIKEFKLLRTYFKIIRKLRPDVVLTYTTKNSVYGGIVCRILKTPYIINNSGLFDPNRIGALFGTFLNLLYKLSYSKTNCLMYQNKSEMDVLNKVLNNKVPYRLLPGSGVNLERFISLPYPEEDVTRFIMICRIQKEKGIEEYLAAASLLKSKYNNIEFHVLGSFDEDYRGVVADFEKRGVVNYHEPVADVRPYLRTSHCVVNPSYHEGMSNVLLEASASSRPCIASDCPGCNDIVDDKVNGYLVKVKDTQDLADKMETFYKLSYDEKIAMGLRGRNKVEKEFDRNIVIDAYYNEINKIIN